MLACLCALESLTIAGQAHLLYLFFTLALIAVIVVAVWHRLRPSVSVGTRLKIGEERMKAILDSATDAIITIDQAQRITVFSRGAERIFRCPAAEAIGQPIDKFIPARWRSVHREHIRAFGETGVSSGRQMGGERVLAAMRADGEEFPIDAQISQSGIGADKLYTVILRDVTDRKRLEREREELIKSSKAAAEQAERANRAKDDFLATVSHELRTPLTTILSWSRMLRTEKLDQATVQKALEAVERAAHSQAQLIEDLLDVSRIIAGRVRLDVRRIDPAVVIDAAIESIRPAAEAKGIRLKTTLDRRAGLVSGDQERLQQIVWNLLSNAIKFTPKGGWVNVVLQRVNSNVEIVVRDTGRGISPEFLPHLFERFRQDDSSTTRRHGGLGLGLAIVRHLVELHGGTVRCESAEAGQGAVFVVTLPLAPIQMARPDEVHPVVDGDGKDRVRAQRRRLDGLRVLLVDDERDTLETLAFVLTEAGAEVQTCNSARAALEIVRSWNPAVLVADIGMPEEDGYELIRKVRSLPVDQGGRTPALALTAYTRIEDRMKALSAGFQMHVPKPIEPDELITVVSSVSGLSIKG